MRKRTLKLAWLWLLAFFCVSASAGKLVVSGDDWPLSQRGFKEEPTSTNALVHNLESYFTHRGSGQWLPSKPGRFLIYGGVGHDILAERLRDDGHDVEFFHLMPATPSLSRLCQFDGVMIRPTPPLGIPPGFDPQPFIQYLQMGGNVYVEAGDPGPVDLQTKSLNGLLEPFGIKLTGSKDGVIHENVSLDSTHPLFRGVETLHWHQGQVLEITKRQGNTPIPSENGLTMFVVSNRAWRGNLPCAVAGGLPLPPIVLPPLATFGFTPNHSRKTTREQSNTTHPTFPSTSILTPLHGHAFGVPFFHTNAHLDHVACLPCGLSCSVWGAHLIGSFR